MRVRPHTKVRSGCFRCKSRKIKCDEGKPQCFHCQRYSVPCIYAAARATPTPSTTSERREIHTDIPKDLNAGTTDLQVEDLELLHHWTISACHGFGDKPGDVHPWKVDMPQQACRYPFLMRGILAVSALHLSRVRPDRKQEYQVRAAYHQDMALPSYRFVVDDFSKNMTEENCSAVVAFGNLTSAYALADLQHPLGNANLFSTSASPTTGVPEWLQLLRGSRNILEVGREWIANGPMAFQLRTVPKPIDLSCNPKDSHLAALNSLFTQSHFSSYDPPHDQQAELDAYQLTLQLLRESAAMPFQPCKTVGAKLAMFIWVEKIPQMYLELLGDRRPEALILLAHVCPLLQVGGSQYWYMEGAAECLLEALRDILHDEWAEWITWPLQAMSGVP